MEKKEVKELYDPAYGLMPRQEKERVITKLAIRHGLKILYFKEFSRFGKSTYTAVLEKDGAEFVFVPGALVNLGWSGKAEDFDRETLEELADAFMELDDPEEWDEEDEEEEDEEELERRIREKMNDPQFLEQVTAYYQAYTSDREEMLIHPLFVERHYQETCWEPVDEAEIAKHPNWLEAIEREGDCPYIEISKEVRLKIDGKDVKADRYQAISFEGLRRRIEAEGYSLPTKREWEYFAGGGCDTLFAWGNDLDLSMLLRYVNDFGIKDEEREYPLEKDNFFGLVLGHNPYEREIVYDGAFSYKGGDGGCNVCGGLGAVLGYFPVSPYYQDPEEEMEEDVNGDFDFFRRVIRIVR